MEKLFATQKKWEYRKIKYNRELVFVNLIIDTGVVCVCVFVFHS